MTSLRDQIDADLKQAMRDKDEPRRDALRLLKSEATARELELGHALGDDDWIGVLNKSVKSRREAIEQFRAGGRDDLVAQEERQLASLTGYLPAMLDEQATRTAIEAIVAELGLAGKKDLGRLMKELKTRHPTVDGKIAANLAQAALG